MKRLLTALLVLLGSVAIAKAQPTCNSALPNSFPCEAQAVNPLATDIVAGTQQTGPQRSNQTVKFSIAQLLNIAGSTVYAPFTGGHFTGEVFTPASITAHAGLNLGQGVAPASPANGDEWITSSGLYVQAGGTTFGPMGAGGSGGVNASTQNAIAYYAANGATVSGVTAANSSVLITSGTGTPSFSTTLPAGLTATSFTPSIKSYTIGTLPSVTTANTGQEAYVTNCQNGTETSGTATGCIYLVNDSGSWVPRPSIPTQTVTIGGQPIALGGATTNAGNGGALQLSTTATKTSGHCVQFDANGNTVDAGGACTTGGGGGTVSAGTVNQLAYYSASGTTVAGLASVNSSILSTNGSGVPAFSTTLPSGLTIPGPTISNPALTGAGTFVGLTGTGKLATAASTTVQAGLNVPAGAAPTSPVNGDLWSTASGFFMRVNGATLTVGTGNGTITQVVTNSPITGGTVTSGSITVACATCLTSASGGALTVSSPLSLSSSALSLGNMTGVYVYNADAFTTVGNSTYYVFGKFPWTSGAITSVSYLTSGTGTPSFNVAVQINGTNVTTCNGITVNSATIATTNCGSNSIASGNLVTLVISGTNGSPSNAMVQVNYARSAV